MFEPGLLPHVWIVVALRMDLSSRQYLVVLCKMALVCNCQPDDAKFGVYTAYKYYLRLGYNALNSFC